MAQTCGWQSTSEPPLHVMAALVPVPGGVIARSERTDALSFNPSNCFSMLISCLSRTGFKNLRNRNLAPWMGCGHWSQMTNASFSS